MSHQKYSHKFYHGDVLIRQCPIPSDAENEIRKDMALAYGEVTGHAHRITDGTVEFLKFNMKNYLRVITTARLTHEEHKPIILPPGDYQFGITKEYDYEKEESRRVAD